MLSKNRVIWRNKACAFLGRMRLSHAAVEGDDLLKILMLNIPNTLNYGSMMMAENLIRYLSREIRDLRGDSPLEQSSELVFVIETPQPEETISRFAKALDGDISPHELEAVKPESISRREKLKRYLSWFLTVCFGTRSDTLLPKGADDVDLVCVLGGDDYTEDYSVLGPVLASLRLAALRKTGRKVVMCGQTIGPFHSWRRAVIAWLLSKVNRIVARDPITHRYLTEDLKLKNAVLAADLAFLPLNEEFEKPVLGLSDDYFTIVPSELIWRFAKSPVRQEYIDFMTDLSLYVLSKHPKRQLLILPHVLAPDGADDRLAGRDLFINLKRRGVTSEKLVFPTCEILPNQARHLIGNSALVITGRMHASISAIFTKTPVLVLSYSRKYWGIIHEYLEMDDLMLDVRFNTWDEILGASIEKTNYIEENTQDLLNRMEDKVSQMQGLAMVNLDVLLQELGYVR